MTTPPGFRALSVGLFLLSATGIVSGFIAVASLLNRDLDNARTWGVITGLAVSFIQIGMVSAGMKIFNIWRKRMDIWASEWALIQQELGRRREFGD